MNWNRDKGPNQFDKEAFERQSGINWIPAVRIFSEISTWIAAPIILALIVGKYLDGRWGTKPTMLLISAGIGFLITSFGIFRTVRNYMRKLKIKN